MKNAIKNLALRISNGLGLKSVHYCFDRLKFHSYSNINRFNIAMCLQYMPCSVSILQFHGKYSIFNPGVHWLQAGVYLVS